MMPWREISREMRQLRVAVVVMFAVSVAATLATGYIEHVAMEQPAESSPAYGYPLHVNDTVRYLSARQSEIYRMAAPVMKWGIPILITLAGLHVLLDNRAKEAARRKRIQELLSGSAEK